jgi:hypothetical protein
VAKVYGARMLDIVVPITLALVSSSLVVSRVLPSCPDCSRAVGFAVSALGMGAVAVFTLAIAIAALQTRQQLVPGDPFAALIWIAAVVVGVALGAVLTAAAAAVALRARR